MSLSGFKLLKDGLHGDQTLLEILDWSFNWAKKWLVTGDIISSSSWADNSGGILNNITENNANGITTAFIDVVGGAIGEQFLVTNTVITAGGRTASRSFLFNIVEKKP